MLKQELVSRIRSGELLTSWKKSTFSAGNGACVEVSQIDHQVFAIRDSKHNQDGGSLSIQPIIICDTEEWGALLDSASTGVTTAPDASVRMMFHADGGGRIASDRDDVVLEFTPDEIAAFIAGVRNGEFGLQPISA